jgi:hypothetical protein
MQTSLVGCLFLCPVCYACSCSSICRAAHVRVSYAFNGSMLAQLRAALAAVYSTVSLSAVRKLLMLPAAAAIELNCPIAD